MTDQLDDEHDEQEEAQAAESALAPLGGAKNYITPDGLQRLKDELKFLLTRERPAVTRVVAWAAGFWLYRKAPKCDAPSPPGNPIAILPALGFVLFVAIAAVAAKWAAGRFGEHGIAVLLLIVGSTDIDTAIITLGGLHPEAISSLLAAMAIAGTIIINMSVKIGITLAYAGRRGLPAVAAMATSIVALAIMIGLAWTRL